MKPRMTASLSTKKLKVEGKSDEKLYHPGICTECCKRISFRRPERIEPFPDTQQDETTYSAGVPDPLGVTLEEMRKAFEEHLETRHKGKHDWPIPLKGGDWLVD